MGQIIPLMPNARRHCTVFAEYNISAPVKIVAWQKASSIVLVWWPDPECNIITVSSETYGTAPNVSSSKPDTYIPNGAVFPSCLPCYFPILCCDSKEEYEHITEDSWLCRCDHVIMQTNFARWAPLTRWPWWLHPWWRSCNGIRRCHDVRD